MAYLHLDDIFAEYALRGPEIRARLVDFSSIPRKSWFYELAYCLLTPQSSAVNASHAIERLQEEQFFERGADPTPVLRDRAHYIRFHNTKARRLGEARVLFPLLQTELERSRSHPDPFVTDGEVLREWLLRNVRGLGWKEASHFLRNIGYRNLAILDRHILRNLRHHGAIRSIPPSVSPGHYRSIEHAFKKFAVAVEIPMDELDLLFWSRETGEIRK
jgi:N-glycosylase/DNA lyase